MHFEEWHDFFVALAGASAAIAGLLFVSLSINIDRIIKMPWLPARAAATMLLLVGAVLESLLALWGRQTTVAAGIEIFVVSLAVWGCTVRLSMGSAKTPPELSRYTAQSVAVVQVAAIPAVAGAAAIALGYEAGLFALAFSMLAAIAVAFLNAWVLLVEILR